MYWRLVPRLQCPPHPTSPGATWQVLWGYFDTNGDHLIDKARLPYIVACLRHPLGLGASTAGGEAEDAEEAAEAAAAAAAGGADQASWLPAVDAHALAHASQILDKVTIRTRKDGDVHFQDVLEALLMRTFKEVLEVSATWQSEGGKAACADHVLASHSRTPRIPDAPPPLPAARLQPCLRSVTAARLLPCLPLTSARSRDPTRASGEARRQCLETHGRQPEQSERPRGRVREQRRGRLRGELWTKVRGALHGEREEGVCFDDETRIGQWSVRARCKLAAGREDVCESVCTDYRVSSRRVGEQWCERAPSAVRRSSRAPATCFWLRRFVVSVSYYVSVERSDAARASTTVTAVGGVWRRVTGVSVRRRDE